MHLDQMLLRERIAALELPTGQYAIFGDAALAAHGLLRAERIDLVVTPELFDDLRTRGWSPAEEGDDEVLRSEDVTARRSVGRLRYPSVAELIGSATEVSGLPVVRLTYLRPYFAAFATADWARDRLRLIDDSLGVAPSRTVAPSASVRPAWRDPRWIGAALAALLVVVTAGWMIMRGGESAEARELRELLDAPADFDAYDRVTADFWISSSGSATGAVDACMRLAAADWSSPEDFVGEAVVYRDGCAGSPDLRSVWIGERAYVRRSNDATWRSVRLEDGLFESILREQMERQGNTDSVTAALDEVEREKTGGQTTYRFTVDPEELLGEDVSDEIEVSGVATFDSEDRLLELVVEQSAGELGEFSIGVALDYTSPVRARAPQPREVRAEPPVRLKTSQEVVAFLRLEG